MLEQTQCFNTQVLSLQGDLEAIALLRANAKIPFGVMTFATKKTLWNAASRLSAEVRKAVKTNPELLVPLVSFAAEGRGIRNPILRRVDGL